MESLEMIIKNLKPYHIKADANYLYVIVSPPYFTLLINGEEFQFIPARAKEIVINRRTKKIANPKAEFAFQKNDDILYITMTELMRMPAFLTLLDPIANPFFTGAAKQQKVDENEVIMDELERLNIRRLIDKSLDERDKESFYTLLKLL